MSISEVAALEGWKESKIAAWESGKSSPTINQLKRLAKRYKYHTMVFYLPEPPNFSVNKLRDFRQLPEDQSREFSSQLEIALRLVGDRQSWAAEYMQQTEELPWTAIRGVATTQNPTDVGKKIRALLGVDMLRQAQLQRTSDAFAFWKSRCENIGVFVFQLAGIELNEMRGCAIFNKYAPIAILNSKDSHNARGSFKTASGRS
ncbi:MAG: helix-turn-helix domain-containing protein [Planctomycetia bacterium]|nr:helix-turn-helix domain-containing protein [Planctomycetia bacterium]